MSTDVEASETVIRFTRPRLLGFALLVMLFALQAMLMNDTLRKAGSVLHGDESYYAGKALALQSLHQFPRVPPPEFGNPFPSKFWGNTDWRPPGYAILLAAVTYPDVRMATTRERIAWIQFCGVATVLTILFFLAVNPSDRTGWALSAALVLGASPWPFAFTTLIGPESTVLVFATAGAVLLGVFTAGAGKRTLLVLGIGCLSLSFLFRPEGIVLVLYMAFLALAVRCTHEQSGRANFWKNAGAAALPFLLVLSLQVCYRMTVAERVEVFGPVRFVNEGAFAWIHTWLNTEEGGYDRFAYRLVDGKPALSELPARAFRDDWEKAQIGKALGALDRGYPYDETIDKIFAQVARKRRHEAWFGSGVIPQASRMLQLWVNRATNTQWLSFLATTPRAFSRTVVGALLAAKLLLLAAAALGILNVATVALSRKPDRTETFTLMFGGYVVGRTVVIGVGLGWMVARYMVPAWPALLWCSLIGFRLMAQRFRRTTRQDGRSLALDQPLDSRMN
jgi:hypothetical protein